MTSLVHTVSTQEESSVGATVGGLMLSASQEAHSTAHLAVTSCPKMFARLLYADAYSPGGGPGRVVSSNGTDRTAACGMGWRRRWLGSPGQQEKRLNKVAAATSLTCTGARMSCMCTVCAGGHNGCLCAHLEEVVLMADLLLPQGPARTDAIRG
jgi:hypothetical protein